MEKQEVMTRTIFDTKERRYDDRKRSVTDLKECAKITLARPLDIKHESLIEMRRGTNERIYNEYRKEECNQKGEVKGNLTEDEKEGLKSLQKRMRNQEIVICKSDKSGKLCVVSREEYIRMGQEHTSKDVEIDRKTIIEKEKQLNGHVFFWSKMWGSGEDHNHRDRIIDSKVVSSEQLADMYILYKDHKEGRKSRPVVTGCNSNTRGFSNSVSDLLESVNKANQSPYEAISGEDMLAKIEGYNQEAEKIMEERREKLCRKMMCKKKDGYRILARCDKLWNKKCIESRRHILSGGSRLDTTLTVPVEANDSIPDEEGRGREDLRHEEGGEEDCGRQKDEETMKHRKHQYKENPRMKITGEDVVQDEIHEVIEHYVGQLKNSGYCRKQAKEVVICGVVGWKGEKRQDKGNTWKQGRPWKKEPTRNY